VEQRHILRLLIGCGDPPEAAQAEARDVIDVNSCIDDRLQLTTLFLRGTGLLTTATNRSLVLLTKSTACSLGRPRRGEPAMLAKPAGRSLRSWSWSFGV